MVLYCHSIALSYSIVRRDDCRCYVCWSAPISVFLVSCFNFSFSLLDENLPNFSCSFSHFLVLVIQISHQKM